jgi:hypothetical protein
MPPNRTLLPSSPRTRRRLLRVGVLLLAVGVVALVIAVVPRGTPSPNRFTSAPVQTARNQRAVPLTRADRREIDSVLDRFVPAAVGRHDPAAAWADAAPELRAGTTREEWARGNLPVQPYPVHSGPTHDWVLLYSIHDRVSLELGLRPTQRATVGNAAFVVGLRRVLGRWRVASIYVRSIYPR